MSERRITLRPNHVAAALAVAMLLLLGAHVFWQFFAEMTGHDHVRGLVPLFDLDREGNVPTFFSAGLLLAGAALAALVAATSPAHTGRAKHDGRRARRRDWALLSLVALYMAFDEAAGIHELLIDPTRDLLGGSARSWLYFAWVVPGALALAALALALRGVLRRLSQPLRLQLAWAAALYFGGAIGVELLAGQHVATHGAGTLWYRAGLVGLEEGLEMAGAILFLRALLDHLARQRVQIALAFAEERRARVREPSRDSDDVHAPAIVRFVSRQRPG